MVDKKPGVLILSPFFSPNIGGPESHLDDLVSALDKRKYKVFVQTYSPITTSNVVWEPREKKGDSIEVTRYGWFGKNLFHQLENYPFLDFLYLTPYLLFRVFLFMSSRGREIDVIHAQGLNAGLVGVILKTIFRKKLVISLHAVYELDGKSLTSRTIAWIVNQADKVLGMSKVIRGQISSLGIPEEKLEKYKYWVDIDRFSPKDSKEARKKNGIDEQFTVLFVGRLIQKKGAKLLVDIAKELSQIQFVLIGNGPEEQYVEKRSKQNKNIQFLGKIKNSELHEFYNSADIFCFPSLYEEGFGRVGMEAVSCGLPVVGSNLGGISEALDDTVAVLVNPTHENLKIAILELYENPDAVKILKKACRDYAIKNFSINNLKLITKHYAR